MTKPKASQNAPVHTAQFAHGDLRFFKAPTLSPEIPWVRWDDLAKCLHLTRKERRVGMSLIRKLDKADLVTIATPDGIVTLCPHYAVQGMVGATEEVGLVPKGTIHDYTMACLPAMHAITGHMLMDNITSMQYSQAALHNTCRRAGGNRERDEGDDSIVPLKDKEFHRRNFVETSYIDEHGLRQRAFDMTEDGMLFLVLGFRHEKDDLLKQTFVRAWTKRH